MTVILTHACLLMSFNVLAPLLIACCQPRQEPQYDGANDVVYIEYTNGTNGASSRIEFVCPLPQEDQVRGRGRGSG